MLLFSYINIKDKYKFDIFKEKINLWMHLLIYV